MDGADLGQHDVQHLGGHRAAEEVALRDVAAQLAQRGHVLGLLDALGDDGQAEVVPEVHGAAHEDGVLRAGRHAEHERAVDLELVHGQPAQVAHRAVPGAEVVDGQPQAEVVQALEHVHAACGVGHDGALGDLEAQHAGGDAVLGQQSLHQVGQSGVEQAAGGQVDRHRQRVTGVDPAPRLGQRQAENPLGEPQDDARSLGHRDELRGRDQAVDRVLPAQQRLDALDPLAVQGELGLVVQEELVVAVQRPAQVTEDGQPRGSGHVVLRREDDGAGLALLRHVQSDVGRAQERLAVGAVPRGDRDADADLDVERHARDVEGPVQRLAQPLRDRLGLRHAVDGRQQDGELVAAEPGHGVAVPQDLGQPWGHLAQQGVAVGVAQAVVDLLEAVEVDEHDGDLGRRPGRRGERLVEPVAQQEAVGQAGQRIVGGGVPVPLGRGVQLLGLDPQPRGRAGHDAEQRRVEDDETADQHHDQHAHLLLHGRGHRGVGQVELDRTVGPVGAVVLHRHVDLEDLRGTGGVAVVGRALDVRHHLAAERAPQVVGVRLRADARVVVGVHDRARAVEDLHRDGVQVVQLPAGGLQPVTGRTDGLLHVGEPVGVEAVLQVLPFQLRLEAQPDRDDRGPLGVLARALGDGVAAEGADDDPQPSGQHEAQHAEAHQEAGVPHAAENGHATASDGGHPILRPSAGPLPSE
nr:hypothetical protein [Blastococcus sp. LR1]